MVWIDYVIIALLGVSTIASLTRGFVRETLSLLTWCFAFFVTSHLYPYLALYFTSFEDKIMRKGIAIIILFITTLMVGAIVNYIFSLLIEKAGLSSIDRMLGLCFGTLCGIFVISMIIFLLNTFTALAQNTDWKQSQLIPYFNCVIRWYFDYINHKSIVLPIR